MSKVRTWGFKEVRRIEAGRLRALCIKDDPDFTKEDALVQVLELLDCNSQFFDLTRDEYDDILSSIV